MFETLRKAIMENLTLKMYIKKKEKRDEHSIKVNRKQKIIIVDYITKKESFSTI